VAVLVEKLRIKDRGPKLAIRLPPSSILHPRSLALLTLLLALTYFTLSIALEVPSLRGRVNDYASLIPPARAQDLGQRLERFESETGHQIAVLTIPSLEGEDIEGFSIKVAEKWKIGQKGFDNGAILLIAKNDRKLRIEVGYGLEGVLPDAIASRIIREVIVPRFRADDYPGGIEAGIEAIMKVTRGESLPVQRRSPAQSRAPDNRIVLILFVAIAVIAFLIGITQRTFSRAALSGGAVATGISITGAWITGFWLLIISLLVGAIAGGIGCAFAAGAWGKPWTVRGSRRERWARDVLYGGAGYGGGWDDSGGGGGFGGGGFSGGGGGFGGGGASGSW
jgi:uncharacterized protein